MRAKILAAPGRPHNARELSGGRRSPDRMVSRLPPSGRARSGRTGRVLWRRYDGSRVARAADLLEMREPQHRAGANGSKVSRQRGLARGRSRERSSNPVTLASLWPLEVYLASHDLRDVSGNDDAAAEDLSFASGEMRFQK
jgi:hypothetical protein